MKSFVMIICSLLFINSATANKVLSNVNINVRDKASLKRGAKYFMNYCAGCHSLKYINYKAMTEDINLKDLQGNSGYINVSMAPSDARRWFDIIPPDLSLSAKEKGKNWLYTYLKSFYYDSKSPFKSNNALVPKVAMPNVLASLEGIKIRQETTDNDSFYNLILQEKGTLDSEHFDKVIKDIVTFLTYAADPSILNRYYSGFKVLSFMILLLFVIWLLKKEIEREYS